jgi:hypothetical protein
MKVAIEEGRKGAEKAKETGETFFFFSTYRGDVLVRKRRGKEEDGGNEGLV